MSIEKDKVCRFCAVNLLNNAKKCKECGEFQSKLYTLIHVGTFITIFFTASSLVIIAFKTLLALLEPNIADLLIHNTNTVDGKFNLVVTNIGAKPAVIYQLELNIPDAVDCDWPVVIWGGGTNLVNKVIKPSETYVIPINTGIHKLDMINNFNMTIDGLSKSHEEELKLCIGKVAYLDYDGKDTPPQNSKLFFKIYNSIHPILNYAAILSLLAFFNFKFSK